MLTVTVYTTGPSCIRCKMTKDVMGRKGVEFVEVDIRENTAAREYVVEDGTGEDHWSGFRPDQIDRIAAVNA